MLAATMKQAWYWAAVGKHPAAGDFIKKDGGVAVLEAFGQWAAQGFRRVIDTRSRKARPMGNTCSWRFWAAARGRHELVCGLGCDSSDSLGRPYPLFLLGQGLMKGWQQHWETIPLMLEPTWRQLEYVSSGSYAGLEAFWSALSSIGQPRADQPDKAVGNDLWGPDVQLELQRHLRNLHAQGRTTIGLNADPSTDPATAAGTWHRLLAPKLPKVPRAVFIGGSLGNPVMVVLLEPLAIEDFVMLWSGPNR